ncbi:hypothetical protein Pan181_19810 [Aeoliella mucimassa]|uniref:Uncharacterized protein n=1 Tax=Aeoliella mucimassa TaxID=2527972 RepID=A0A518AM32_9BACT|nr:hypothetical protein Pan181_19810 [Aeoliella mucimassa]
MTQLKPLRTTLKPVPNGVRNGGPTITPYTPPLGGGVRGGGGPSRGSHADHSVRVHSGQRSNPFQKQKQSRLQRMGLAVLDQEIHTMGGLHRMPSLADRCERRLQAEETGVDFERARVEAIEANRRGEATCPF